MGAGEGLFTAVPVEYAVAADRYLATLRLGHSSRRVYRIALATWAWTLVDSAPPRGRDRRGASPPVVPLAVLDDQTTSARLHTALEERAATVDPRTINRELSILRGAIAWWRMRGWIAGDPLEGLRAPPIPPGRPDPLGAEQIRAIFRLPADLREQALWHLTYDAGAPIERILGLDVTDIDQTARRTYRAPEIRWGPVTARLLSLLLTGRTHGPVFLAGRRRLSYRRAAELFTAATRPLDPNGHGWTLRQLRSGPPRDKKDRG